MYTFNVYNLMTTKHFLSIFYAQSNGGSGQKHKEDLVHAFRKSTFSLMRRVYMQFHVR